MNNRIPNGILASQFWHEAIASLRAAEILIRDEGGPDVIPPTYLLMSHGLELLLKAYLLARDVPYGDVSKLQHDIHAAYQKARDLGLVAEGEHSEALIEIISEFHKAQVFRYPIVKKDDGHLVLRGHLVRPIEVLRIVETIGAKIGGHAVIARIRAAKHRDFPIETWNMGKPGGVE